MRRICLSCREWDPYLGRYRYRLAQMTKWRPHVGLDPNIREFECDNCGEVFYILLGKMELQRDEEKSKQRS